MSDERPNSLAAQAASWVPPWERAQRPPDPAYAAAAPEPDVADDIDETDAPERDASPVAQADDPAGADAPEASDDSAGADAPEASDDRAGADAPEASDDAAGADAPDDAAGDDVPPELPPLPGEAEGGATVDAPQELPGEDPLEPTEVGGGPEVPLPPSISEAVEGADEDFPGSPVDAPLPPDGDDAGDVFDVAADDEVDDAEIDLPFTEEVPDATADEMPDASGIEAPSASDAGMPDASADEAWDARAGDAAAVGEAGPVGEAAAVGEAGPVGEAAAVGEAGPVGEAAAVGGAKAMSGAAAGAEGAGPGGAAIPAQGRGRADAAAAVGERGPRTPEEAGPPAPMDDAEMRAALEAVLLVVDEPVAEMQLAQILEQPTERVAAMLEDISARYTAAGHGFDLRRAAGGWRLYTRPEYAAYVERFVLDGQSVRLTQAALETLAVVAYKQPVTRSRISAIRGVNCDGVMRTLVTRGLVEECGTESETGAYLYRTTALFLEKLGLNSVDQLPPLAPFLPDDVEEVLDASG